MADKITVVNRTANNIIYRIGENNPSATVVSPRLVSGWLSAGQAISNDVDGTAPYMVSAVTTPPNVNNPPNEASLNVYNVFPGSIVTFATEVGTRGEAEDEAADDEATPAR